MSNTYLFVLLLFQACFSQAQPLAGNWEGTLQLPSASLALVLTLEQSNGTWEGSLMSPQQSSQRIAMTALTVDGDSVRFSIEALQLSYAGLRQGDQLRGVFQQGALRQKLDFRQLAATQEPTPLRRPQLPHAPYPYDTVEVQFRNTYDAVELAGTLTLPQQAGKYPAVVLLTGSGPQDRNETILGHQPFKVIADYLTRHKIIVLRYDDRGIGQSGGNFAQATTADFSKDAMSAIDFLKAQPMVDTSKIGLIGHSEGGLIATLLAGQHYEDLDFIISLAGPAIRMDELLLLQAEAVTQSSGGKLTEEQRTLIRENYRLAMSDLPYEGALQAIMDNMRGVPGSQSASFANEVGVLVTPWYRYFLRIDPVPYLKNIKIPFYAAYGSKDIQVPMGANLESLSDYVPAHPQSVFKGYEGLNHLFQKASLGTVGEYGTLEETFNKQVLDDITKWIQEL